MSRAENTPTPKRTLGAQGERVACDYLTRIGYTVVARNWRTAHLEVDIIVTDERSIVFVEVKTRTGAPGAPSRYGRPAAAVDYRKRENLRTAASTYIREVMGGSTDGKQPRLDVVEVYISRDGNVSLNHIRNAFGARERGS